MKQNSHKTSKKYKPVGLIYDHIVFHCKFNKKVLIHNVRKRCEQIISEVLIENKCELVEMSVQPDHVHILVGIPIDIPPSTIVMKVKGRSAYVLRKEFPILIQHSKKSLWSPSTVHTSVGNDYVKVLCYIRNQQEYHERKNAGRAKT